MWDKMDCITCKTCAHVLGPVGENCIPQTAGYRMRTAFDTTTIRGTERTERNQLRTITGDFATLDRASWSTPSNARLPPRDE